MTNHSGCQKQATVFRLSTCRAPQFTLTYFELDIERAKCAEYNRRIKTQYAPLRCVRAGR